LAAVCCAPAPQNRLQHHTGAMPAALRSVSKQRKEITVWGLQPQHNTDTSSAVCSCASATGQLPQPMKRTRCGPSLPANPCRGRAGPRLRPSYADSPSHHCTGAHGQSPAHQTRSTQGVTHIPNTCLQSPTLCGTQQECPCMPPAVPLTMSKGWFMYRDLTRST
jgi:hypothetical protein